MIDAVGVTETAKTTMRPIERQRTVSFEKLLDHVASGDRRDETLASLAARLARLDAKIDDADRTKVVELTGGQDLHSLSTALLEATEPERIEQTVTQTHGPSATDEQRSAVEQRIKDEAARPFDNPALRQHLKDAKQRAEMVIDEISIDQVLGAGFDLDKAKATTQRFNHFIEEHKDQLTALQILYSRPAAAQRLTYAHLQELAHALTSPPWVLDTAIVWQAYKRLDAAKVRGEPMEKVLTELVALVRYAIGRTDALESFAVGIDQRFNLWIGRQKKAGREFSEEQMRWLQLIKRFVAQNVEIAPRDLLEAPTFTHEGGLVKARQLFGKDDLASMLDDLTEALAA